MEEIQGAAPDEISSAATDDGAAEVAAPVLVPDRLAESRALTKSLDEEIAAFERGEIPPSLRPEPDPQPAEASAAEPAPAAPEAPAVGSEATPEPKADAKPDAPIDPEQIRAEERARIERERAEADAAAERAARLAADQAAYQQRVEAYVGRPDDHAALNAALDSALRGDYAPLDKLDILLPSGKRVSEIRGQAGLTQDEALAIRDGWQAAANLQDAVGDRKVQTVLGIWNQSVLDAVRHPDVDADRVLSIENPGEQMRALRESVAERVTQRLTTAHQTAMAAKDATIAELNERIKDLELNAGALRKAAVTAGAVTPPAPGVGSTPTRAPTIDELQNMSIEEFTRREKELLRLPVFSRPVRGRTG